VNRPRKSLITHPSPYIEKWLSAPRSIGAGPLITLCGSHISRCAASLKIRRPSIVPPPSCSSSQRDMSLTLEMMPPAGAIESQLTHPMLATGLSNDACGVA